MCAREKHSPLRIECVARGKCVVQRGVAVCVCEQGFLGQNCGLACPGAEAGSVCGERGRCQLDESGANTRCMCTSGFLGVSCTVECPGSTEDGRACSGKGECSLTASNTAMCKCPLGSLGADCGLECPTDMYGNVCSGVGACSDVCGALTCAWQVSAWSASTRMECWALRASVKTAT